MAALEVLKGCNFQRSQVRGKASQVSGAGAASRSHAQPSQVSGAAQMPTASQVQVPLQSCDSSKSGSGAASYAGVRRRRISKVPWLS